MRHDRGPPEPLLEGSHKFGRDPSEDGSVPAPLQRPRRHTAVIRPQNSTPSAPSPLGSRPDVARSRPSRAVPERVRGGSYKTGRDPSEDGSVPAPLPRRCALRRPSYGRTDRPTRPQVRSDLDRMRQDPAFRPSPTRVRGGVVIEFGGVCYQDTYPDMYRDVSCVYPEGYMYP
jgi:hypothetical protein